MILKLGINCNQARVLDLTLDGMDYVKAAERLNVSYSAVSHHMQNICKRLNCRSRMEMTRKAKLTLGEV